MHDIFIAKLGEDGSWLPLSQHLKDTADVMRHLCGKYVTGSMIAATGLNAEQFHQIAVFCAAAHDMGKAIRAYQGKITDRSLYYRQILKNEGLSIKNKGIEELSPHALAGATILNQFFHVNESVCEIIAAHHGKPRTKDTEMDFDIQLTHHAHNYYSQEDENRYKGAWKEIFDTAMSQAEMQENEFPVITLQGKMLLSGLVIMADRIASNEEFFSLFPPGIIENSDERANAALSKLSLPDLWAPEYFSMDDRLFGTRFQSNGKAFTPNYLQRAAIATAEDADHGGIMIIEAPMGIGKTEAALAAAEILASKSGCGGLFFGLPTQGTANGMFGRMLAWAKTVSEGMTVSVNFAHGSSRENALFRQYKSRIYDETDGLQINEWMSGRHWALRGKSLS